MKGIVKLDKEKEQARREGFLEALEKIEEKSIMYDNEKEPEKSYLRLRRNDFVALKKEVRD